MDEQEVVRPKSRKKKMIILYRGPKAQYDYILLFAMLCLMVFGLIMLYSVTNYSDMVVTGDSFDTVKKQFIFMVIGLVALVAVTFFDYHFYLRMAPFVLLIVVFMCLITMFFGVEINGQRRWLALGGFQFQASELAKPALILILARVLTVHYKPKKRGKRAVDPKLFCMGMGLTLLADIFVIFNNLSTGIILFCIGFFMLYTASKTKWIYPFLIVFGLTVLVLAYRSGALSAIGEFRMRRIYAWLDPEKYETAGYQIMQSLYAVSSGGLFGKGLGTSIQKLGFLPEAQNDMIFAIICEELGMIGAVFTMLLFAVLISRIHRVAQRAKDMSGFMIVSGVMIHMIIQVLFNISVAANVMPNTGVTLPFISYGGTAVICTLGEIGLVLAVDRQNPSESDIEEARG